jgi:transposase
MPTITGDKTAAEINREDLIMLIRGLDYENVHRRKRFKITDSQPKKVDEPATT